MSLRAVEIERLSVVEVVDICMILPLKRIWKDNKKVFLTEYKHKKETKKKLKKKD